MKTQPIRPAEVDFSDAAAPSAPGFGDVYHARAGAFAQAQHVFLGGNELPRRWQGRARFVILETGFGLGNNFLATWAAWRADPQRAERLVFISVEKHPLRHADLQRAHAHSPEPALAAQLLAQWPPLTHNLHVLDFEQGRVRLMLGLGEARDWLAEIVAEVDAFYLDGFSPALNPDIWDPYLLRSLGRLAAPQATAATWSVARPVRDGLASAGFEVRKAEGFASKGQMSVARYQPRHAAQRPAGRLALAPGARTALVLGAGIAGAACAHALAAQGLDVSLLESRQAPALAGSGNPGGLFHGTLNPDDGLHARFNRAAALHTERNARALLASGHLPWLQPGLLRLEMQRDLATLQAQIERLGLPADYVQALSREQACERAGWPLSPAVTAAWFYPGGGALPPPGMVQALIETAARPIRLRTACRVSLLRRCGESWQCLDESGRVLAEAESLVLAAGADSLALLDTLDEGRLGPLLPPLNVQRGQISRLGAEQLAQGGLQAPRLPLAGAGYALGLPDGGLVFGATHQDGDTDPEIRDSDHEDNLAQLALLSPQAMPKPALEQGRVGWRLIAPDRLPLVGGLGLPVPGMRLDQVRMMPRLPGLALCTAMASRGLSWALLCGELLASRVTGAPAPMEASLLDALDPLRFLQRQTRQG
ncbi:FAD-dependent 5-carboxymethylaminomethyl-2-thiouridine(34) oxidoreductase MnmC [Mitsuaria sp. WAJ17]|uniref:FAD-dependent 5-carboxymethylaminomethyl-2-thiouridine(34) oxidoreductase MnmC n=1 Tax=Mitsuaria sp. WAJ17 TaxID=2761452 RepID=UPI001603CD16|nr:FAD-dependent 5-carboxymethylaminomethyl-2-thiouridine(34) oxidoreductase MnmC [Mitsuaria sp. WAJ17]MBB2487994.1 FAD-dependent 5-carboxymethylaminomethyl-2-thiouridine(34) oxidoreductase MnmC [Mitsuaria sp. WAJ17]